MISILLTIPQSHLGWPDGVVHQGVAVQAAQTVNGVVGLGVAGAAHLPVLVALGVTHHDSVTFSEKSQFNFIN